MWVHQLKRAFPDALIIRDYQFHSHPIVGEVLLTDRNDFEVRPDIFMSFESHDGIQPVSVAIEIERSRKADRRVKTKLDKYANETGLDGVVYICDTAEIGEPVRRIYQKSCMDKSLRISHYGKYFFLYKNQITDASVENRKMFNAVQNLISLEQWIHTLRETPLISRRNHLFDQPVSSCGQKKIE